MPEPAGASPLGLLVAEVLLDRWPTLLFMLPRPSRFSLPSKDLVAGGPIMNYGEIDGMFRWVS